jgi:hypothetical protein
MRTGTYVGQPKERRVVPDLYLTDEFTGHQPSKAKETYENEPHEFGSAVIRALELGDGVP